MSDADHPGGCLRTACQDNRACGRSVVTTRVRAALGARSSAAAISNAGLMRTVPRVRSWRKSREMPPGC
jgi:hypothetical protein